MGNPFSLTGRIYFDGAGNVLTASSSQGGGTALAGTYSVNMDCTVTVTLSDSLGTNKTSKTFQGIILGGGTELDLVTPAPTISTTTTGTGTGTVGSSSTAANIWFVNPPVSQAALGTTLQPGVLIRLTKLLFSSGCTTSNLMGPYGLVASGVQTQTTGTTTVTGVQPFVLLGRAHFDGNGNIVADQTSPNSPLAILDFTGTYTVNPDCSGTMTLMVPNTNTTATGTGTSTTLTGATSTSPMTVTFVLGQPSISVPAGSPAINWNTLRPSLSISVSNANQTAFGYGMAQ